MPTFLVLAFAPAEEPVLGVPGSVLHGALLLLALLLFAFILYRRIRLLARARADPRLDRLGARSKGLLVLGFGQARQPRYPLAGTIHILIFFGFLILLLRSLTLLGEGFVPGFALPGLSGAAGRRYASLEDWTALVVLLACAVAAWRRLVLRPARYHDRLARRPHGYEGYVILGWIALLLVASAFQEGSGRALEGAGPTAHQPLASAAAALLGGAGVGAHGTVHLTAFWLHDVALLAFLCYLPLSKHFHVLTALPNVFFRKLPPAGRLKPPRHGVEDLDSIERLGVSRLEDLTWKHVLDAWTCTDCGRCTDNCPAYATGAPLSPRMISIATRDAAYDAYPVLGRTKPPEERPAFVGEVVEEAAVWACTTCAACEDVCPVLIEYVDKIVDMRRALVEDGRVPKGLQKALADVEKKGNPYGKMARKRGAWIETEDGDDAPVRILEKGERAEVLYFTDSCTAFDPRIQRIARSFAGLLDRAGLACGTLGRDEVDSGNEVRRIGEEGLFEVLREKNRAALQARAFDRIVTSDPHALNTLRNDGYDLAQPVLHHAQVLDELIRGGRLRLGALDDDRTYCFHDPCYLGRHNGIYDPPRAVLDAVPGLERVEMARSRNRSFCCGGGSLYLFHEGESESRMGEQRLAMAEEAGAQVIVTACPFCLINLEDAILTTGRQERMEVVDLAEVVTRAAGAP
ncbi:MAG: (Fe-S)-binding protein [Planctomycetota bacterium]